MSRKFFLLATSLLRKVGIKGFSNTRGWPKFANCSVIMGQNHYGYGFTVDLMTNKGHWTRSGGGVDAPGAMFKWLPEGIAK